MISADHRDWLCVQASGVVKSVAAFLIDSNPRIGKVRNDLIRTLIWKLANDC